MPLSTREKLQVVRNLCEVATAAVELRVEATEQSRQEAAVKALSASRQRRLATRRALAAKQAAALQRAIAAAVAPVFRGIVNEVADNLLRFEKSAAKAFCPTGPGGGIDNSCGRDSTSFPSVGYITTAAGEVAVTYDPSVTNKETAELAKQWLDRIPAAELAKSTAHRFVIYDNPEDVTNQLESLGIAPDEGGANGAYDFKNKIVYAAVWDGYGNSPRTLFHEIGHSVVGYDEDAAETWAQTFMPQDVKSKAFCPTGLGGGIDNSCGRGSSGTFKVTGMLLGMPIEGEVLDKEVASRMGRNLNAKQLADAAGALPGCEARILIGTTAIEVKIKHISYEAIRTFQPGSVVISNDGCRVHNKGQGFGTNLFKHQVDAAAATGFKAIETIAEREDGIYNGYYTWPRLGYDAELGAKGEKQPPNGATRLSELMRTEDGRKWWKKNGTSKSLTFDLTEGSQSRKVLDAYVEAKRSGTTTGAKSGGRGIVGRDLGRTKAYSRELTATAFTPGPWKQKLVDAILPVLARGMGQAAWTEVMLTGAEAAIHAKRKKAFCPTGPGGGIDNSCGRDGGNESYISGTLYARGDNGGVLLYHSTNKKAAISLETEGILDESLNQRDSGFFGKGFYTSAEPQDFYGKSLIAIELKTTAKILDAGPLKPSSPMSWHVNFESSLRNRILKHRPNIEQTKLNAILEEVTPGTPTFSHISYIHELRSFANSEGFDIASFSEGQETVIINKEVVSKIQFVGGITTARRHYESHLPKEAKATKATSATEWLQATGQKPPPGTKTEWPPWLIKAIEEQLQQAFEEDYWDEIVDVTTAKDIEKVIAAGLEAGESIRDISHNIRKELGTEYYHNRAKNIAITEAGNALNGGRKLGIDALKKELGPDVPLRAVWLSILGDTTRDAHANLDGVPADENGMWNLDGHLIPWPGHVSLPASQRCFCYCSVVSELGMDDERANELLADYHQRLIDYEAGTGEFAEDKAFCPTGPGGGVDNSCGPKQGTAVHSIEAMDEDTLLNVLGVSKREEPISGHSFGIQSETYKGIGRVESSAIMRGLGKDAKVSFEVVRAAILPTVFGPFNDTYAGTAVPASIERALGVSRSKFDVEREASRKAMAKGTRKRDINNDLNMNGFTMHARIVDDKEMDSLVSTTYTKTQSVLHAAGIKEIKLYRGMGVVRIDAKGNAVESWTADIDVAKGFAEAYKGEVETKTIPANRIFATPATGWGVGSQVEVLVLGSEPGKADKSTEGGYALDELRWERWLKSADEEVLLGDKAFCPTGPGGGIDNSCGRGGQNKVDALAMDDRWRPYDFMAVEGGFSTPADPIIDSVNLYHVTTVDAAAEVASGGWKLGQENFQGFQAAVSGVYGWSNQPRAHEEIKRAVEQLGGKASEYAVLVYRVPKEAWGSLHPDEDAGGTWEQSYTDGAAAYEGIPDSSWLKEIQTDKGLFEDDQKATMTDDMSIVPNLPGPQGSDKTPKYVTNPSLPNAGIKAVTWKEYFASKAANKAACHKPAGQSDGGQFTSCGDGVGDLSGIDMSTWAVESNPIAKWAKSKIAQMEDLALNGNFDEIPIPPKPKEAWETYKQAVYDAYYSLKTGYDELAAEAGVDEGIASVAHPEAVSEKGWEKLGGKLGTVDGGTYKGPDGLKYYVKFPADPQVARNEVLASRLFALAGGKVVENHLVEFDGKIGVAHKWEEDSSKVNWESIHAKQKASEDFAIHAWLANHDAIGAGSENPMDNVRWIGTKLVAVDVGGAMNYTGTGNPKQWDGKAQEWETLRNASINPSAAKVFGGMTEAQLQESAAKLQSISGQAIADLVHKYNGDNQSANTILTVKLMDRRDAIFAKAGLASVYETQTIPPKPEAIIDSLIPSKLTSSPINYSAPAIPPAPIVTSAANASAQKKFDAIYAAAVSGNISAVEAIKTNPTSGQTYVKKQHQYKMQVLAAMQAGGKANPDHAEVTKASVLKVTAKVKPKPASVAAPVAPKPVVIDPGLFPEAPTFASQNAAQVATNNATINQAKEYAKKGDLTALQSVSSPSPKVMAYVNELKVNLAEQLNPPPVPTFINADFVNLTNHISHLPKVGADKIGHWSVLGDVGGVPAGIPNATWNASGPAKLWSAGTTDFNKMSADAKSAIKSYTGGGYHSINNSLRSLSPSSDAKAAIEGVTKHGTPLTPGIKVSRKYTPDDAYSQHVQKFKVGHVVSERGFLSTSTSPHVWSGTIQFHITIGPGVIGLPAKKYSKSGQGESEIILPPNQRLLITKVEKTNEYGSSATVHAVALPAIAKPSKVTDQNAA